MPTTTKKTVAWIITQDHISTDTVSGEPRRSFVGTRGPRGADFTQPLNHPFRLLDDDGELYFEGITNALDPELSDERSVFAPLDDFGMPMSGCTTIQYRMNGKWESV